MKGAKKWKGLAALSMSAALLFSQITVYAQNPSAVEEPEMMSGAQSDKSGFQIENGILKKYTGTAAEVVIPDGVTSIGERELFIIATIWRA